MLGRLGLGDRVVFGPLLALAMVACGGSGDQADEANYRYGAAEVEALVLGSWIGTWTDMSGASPNLALEVSRQPAQRTACGSRELAEGTTQGGPSSSVQCVSSSDMLLRANLSVDGMFSALPLTGEVTIVGYELHTAGLSLLGTEIQLYAQWTDGQWSLCRAQRPNGDVMANCTLERAP